MSLTVGVLGLGSIGMRHSRNLLALGASVLGYDLSAERRALLAGEGGEATGDRARVLAEAGAVVIASPSAAHLTDLTDAVAAGLPALVEKPLAHTERGLVAVLDAAEARGIPVFAAMNQRFNPAVRSAREVLAARTIGRPVWARLIAASYLPHWRPHQDYRSNYTADPATGGVLFDFIHEFDLAVHLLGPAEVAGAAARRTGLLDMASEDCSDTVLRHAGGVQSAIHLDFVSRPRRRSIEIGGDAGWMLADLENGRLQALDVEGKPLVEREFPRDANAMYLEEMTAFLACVTERTPPACDGRQALAALRLVIEARRRCGLPEA